MCVLRPVWAATLGKTTEEGSGEDLKDHLRSLGLALRFTSGHKTVPLGKVGQWWTLSNELPVKIHAVSHQFFMACVTSFLCNYHFYV